MRIIDLPLHAADRELLPAVGRGIGAMAEEGEKFRFAMGVFDELPRLQRAVSELLDLGLDPRNICLAGERSTVETSNASQWAGSEHIPHLVLSPGSPPALELLSDGAAMWNAEAPVLKALRERVSGLPASPLATDFWLGLGDHLRGGGLLLIAKMPSATLQDQAVRALLKYSLYPVHAEEFFCKG